MTGNLNLSHAGLAFVLVAGFAQGCVDTAGEEPPRTANRADRAYVDAMIAHHGTTIQLARLAETRASAPSVRRMGRRVVARRTMELDVLSIEEESLDIARVPRATTPATGRTEDPATARREISGLRRADDFDASFVTAMIRHEQHDVEMSRFALKQGRDAQVRRAARQILRDRRGQLRVLRRIEGSR